MHIFRLLNTASPASFRHILAITCLAGLANAILLAMVNQAAESAALAQPIGNKTLLLYICMSMFFFIADRASLREANRLVQHRLEALRLRLVGKIRRVDLHTLERQSHGELFATIAQEINHLSQSLPLLVSAAQSVFMLAFCLLYIALLSFISFLVVTGFTAIGLYLFWLRRRSLNQALAQVYHQESEMLDTLTHFTKGFQEIRLHADKNDALFRRFFQIVQNLQTNVVGVSRKWVSILQFSNAFMYALVGTVIFILPIFFHGYTDVIYKITAAAIFCVGSVTALTAAAPLYTKADMGLGHVAQLEAQLSDSQTAKTPIVTESRFKGFSVLTCHGLAFSYRDADGETSFTSGPLDLTLTRGETVFLTGGNGSGKSTTMKLLCGLYTPDGGSIAVDGTLIGEAERQDYRELFSAIFTDFHLFDRLYGLGDVDPATVAALISRMELDGKVTFADGRFSTTSLSTGQRKRLAMIVSLLEDRDIYLFDEWAADQDAHFREIFYRDLLPDLKRRGKTVLAVTHDDRYWSCCDRRLSMDLGILSGNAEGRA